MASNYKLTYGVDLVFCIDATMSMQPMLDTVKNNALNFYHDFQKLMNEKRKTVTKVRIRVIAFRDYEADGEEAMLVTDFFTLPDQAEDFRACLESIHADGGGDDPEDGLEALAYAMKSKWDNSCEKKRHVIVVWSDEGTHELGFARNKAKNYPSNMAKDFVELSRWWGSPSNPGLMDENAKRLLIYAPDKQYWNTIVNNWSNTIQYVTENVGEGLKEVEYDQILNAIANSI